MTLENNLEIVAKILELEDQWASEIVGKIPEDEVVAWGIARGIQHEIEALRYHLYELVKKP